ncbi:hypothetical protein BASA81_005168 [Batrachochytrium salamandrivorans]|nr:hypothetical protein BASA81_005168 [Batrachochytrium salamandrivorans]
MKSMLLLLLTLLFASALAAEDGSAAISPPPAPPKLISVTTLTRHGSRAPDKILATVSCQPLLMKTTPDEGVKKVFVNKFGTLPGELTAFGQVQMETVGRWLKHRYGKSELDFVNTENYLRQTKDWQFTARAGNRQQRSMMGIAQGIFSKTSVPIAVTARNTDAVLGGPAPQCGSLTAPMIVDWHATKGKQIVLDNYADAVEPFEKMCNVSLKSNPVNAAPGGPNPHAWIGDVSDLLDSFEENFEENELPKPMRSKEFPKQFDLLTDFAFRLEQESHFDDPRGAVMFAGEFPNNLLSRMESIEQNAGKRPKGVAKMHLFACSRELEYGMSHLFGWEQAIHLNNQPQGRVKAGSTMVWELWKVDGKYYVDTLLFQPPGGINEPLESLVLKLQNRTLLSDYRAAYERAINGTGNWRQVCNVPENEDEFNSFFTCTTRKLMGKKQPVKSSSSSGKKQKKFAGPPPVVPSLNELPDLLSRSTAFILSGQAVLAEPLLKRALELAPACTEALDLAGEMFVDVGEYSKAVLAFEHSVQLAPEESHTKYMFLGQLKTGLLAMEMYEKGCMLLTHRQNEVENARHQLCQTKVAMAELWLTDLCMEPNAEQQCELVLQQALQYDPNSLEAMQTLASFKMSQNKPDEAKQLLQRVVQSFSPDNGNSIETGQSFEFSVQTCRLLIELNCEQECLPLLEVLIQEDDENVECWILLGLCHSNLGDRDTAIECWESAKGVLDQFIALDPTDELFQAQVAYVRELVANAPPPPLY